MSEPLILAVLLAALAAVVATAATVSGELPTRRVWLATRVPLNAGGMAVVVGIAVAQLLR